VPPPPPPLVPPPGSWPPPPMRGDRKAVILSRCLEYSGWVNDLSEIAIWLGAAGCPALRVLARALEHRLWVLARWAVGPAEHRSAWAPERWAALSPDVPAEAPALERSAAQLHATREDQRALWVPVEPDASMALAIPTLPRKQHYHLPLREFHFGLGRLMRREQLRLQQIKVINRSKPTKAAW